MHILRRTMSWLLVFLMLGICCVEGGKYDKFPDWFKFGATTNAAAIEGASYVGFKRESMAEHAYHDRPNLVNDASNGDYAADSFHMYKDDVQLLKKMKLDYYRFSIAWTRVLPAGNPATPHEEGLQYYDDLINELVANHIEPVVVIYYGDFPQHMVSLERNLKLLFWNFLEYAELLFARFGDRVKTWITFNDPVFTCNAGYSKPEGVGNYKCALDMLTIHAMVHKMYHIKYEPATGQGLVGLSINCPYYYPKTDDIKDSWAANRAMQFQCGLFLHPIFHKNGDFPEVVVRVITQRNETVLKMSRELKYLIKGSADFIGLNYYTSEIAAWHPGGSINEPYYIRDMNLETSANKSWVQGPFPGSYTVPQGLTSILNFFREKYNNPPVIITENGYGDHGSLSDWARVKYLQSHFQAVLNALNDGCRVMGHTTYSLLDGFENEHGYIRKYGLNHVDFTSPWKERSQRLSAQYMRILVTSREI